MKRSLESSKKNGTVFLQGDKVYLRGLNKKDFHGPYFDWLNDPKVTRYLQSGLFPNSKEKMRDNYKQYVSGNGQLFLAIIDKKNKKHIGNIKLGPINWVHRFSEFGILIGEKKYWGKGFGYEATRLLLDHAFDKLNIHRIRLGVVDENKSAIRSYLKLGFKIEGKAREQFFIDGKYRDVIYMGVLEDEYRKQGMKKKK